MNLAGVAVKKKKPKHDVFCCNNRYFISVLCLLEGAYELLRRLPYLSFPTLQKHVWMS